MRKVKATSTGTPPISGAQAFAWMLAAVTGKRPVLKVVDSTAERSEMKKTKFVPVTPAGTPCDWLESSTEKEAWDKLLKDAAHMPYKTKENFIKRGYTVEKWSA